VEDKDPFVGNRDGGVGWALMAAETTAAIAGGEDAGECTSGPAIRRRNSRPTLQTVVLVVSELSLYVAARWRRTRREEMEEEDGGRCDGDARELGSSSCRDTRSADGRGCGGVIVFCACPCSAEFVSVSW
jgi:hypothetical protein